MKRVLIFIGILICVFLGVSGIYTLLLYGAWNFPFRLVLGLVIFALGFLSVMITISIMGKIKIGKKKEDDEEDQSLETSV
jgi:hypothetical protein